MALIKVLELVEQGLTDAEDAVLEIAGVAASAETADKLQAARAAMMRSAVNWENVAKHLELPVVWTFL